MQYSGEATLRCRYCNKTQTICTKAAAVAATSTTYTTKTIVVCNSKHDNDYLTNADYDSDVTNVGASSGAATIYILTAANFSSHLQTFKSEYFKSFNF